MFEFLVRIEELGGYECICHAYWATLVEALDFVDDWAFS